jgi:2-polyprenyl-3-methyl-5-hydroxy-6-metoxy-1,4-benzoquinol methylase/3-polyprenyl-4-hydroxybenzoate decarboxylase
MFDDGTATTVVGRDGVARRLESDSAELLRTVMAFLVVPRTRDELLAHLALETGSELSAAEIAVIDELLVLLRQARAVIDDQPPLAPPAALPGARIVLCVSGAAAAMHAPVLVGSLLARGHELQVTLTRRARRFVQPEALAALTHTRVYTQMSGSDPTLPAPHVHLAEWADLVLLCPATATTIARLAHGDFSELGAAVAQSTRAPVLVVPSMNAVMRESPAVARNLETLRGDGFFVAHPALGVEVNDPPSARVPMLGPAPPAEDVVALVDAVIATRARAGLPRSPVEWESLYASRTDGELPWHSESADVDLLARLEGLRAPGALLLDLGTGLGTVARAAAGLGYHVVATDVSDTVLARAAARANGAPVTWLRDDMTRSTLAARFHVLVDRACLGVIPPERTAAYVASLSRLAGPGATLLLKTLDPSAPAHLVARRFSADEVRATFAPAFELVEAVPSTLPGPAGPASAPPALFCILRRR